MGEMTTIQEVQEVRDAKAAAFIAGFNDPGGHRAKATRLRMQRAAQMVLNRAALPKPPAYARDLPDRHMGLSDAAIRFFEREGNLLAFRERQSNLLERPEGMKRREPLKAPAAPPREETIAFLFAQLKEMGVSCTRCSKFRPQGQDHWCRTYNESQADSDEFCCIEWEGK